MMVVTTRQQPQRRHRSWLAFTGGATFAALSLVSAGVLVGLFLDGEAEPEDRSIAAVPDRIAAPTVADSIDVVADEATDQNLVAPNAEVLAAETSPAKDATPPNAAMLEDLLVGFDLDRISFDRGTIQLTPTGLTGVADLATILLAEPDEPVELLIHTFSESTPGLNHGLSLRQAEVIATQLTNAGVDRQRLGTIGMGSSGAEAPRVAAAIKIEASDPEQKTIVLAGGPVMLDEPFSGVFSPATSSYLAALGESLATQPEHAISLVGYSWHGADEDQNHHESHHLLDAAYAEILAGGARPRQVSMVGLGELDIALANQQTVIEVQTGAIAAIGVSLSEIDVDVISFVPGSSELSADGAVALANVAEILLQDQAIRVEVAVHTYSEATSQANHDLSRRQGDTIFTHLLEQGIAPTQLHMVWHGDPPHFAAPGRAGAVTFTVIR